MTPARRVTVALLALLALPSCVAVAAAAGAGAGVLYAQGNLTVLVDATPKEVRDAAKWALGDLDIAVISADSTAVDASVVGRTATDTRISITAERRPEGTRLVIRVGILGDETLSALIYERMQTRL
jgi:hypothetical protein